MRGARRHWIVRSARRAGWILLALLLAVTALVGLTLEIARLPWGRDFIRAQALSIAQETLPGLDIGAIGGDYTDTFSLHDLRLADRFGHRAVTIEMIAIDYDLWALLEGSIHVEELRIVRPRVFVETTNNGALNVAELLHPSPESEPETESDELLFTWAVKLDRLAIEQGFARVAQAAESIVTARNIGLKAGASYQDGALRLDLHEIDTKLTIPGHRPFDVKFSGAGGIGPDGLELRTTSRLSGLSPDGSIGLDLRLDGSVERFAARLDGNLPAGGRLALRAYVENTDSLQYVLTLQADRVQLHEILPGLPRSHIQMAAAIEGQGIPATENSRAALVAFVGPSQILDTRIDSLLLIGALADEHWRANLVEASALGVHLSVQARGSFDSFDASFLARAPALEKLSLPLADLPRLAGGFRAEGRVAGPFEGPYSGTVSFDAERLQVDSVQIATAAGQARFEGLPSRPVGRFTLEASDLRTDDPRLRLDELRISAAGNPQRFSLQTDAKGPEIQAMLEADAEIGATVIDVDFKQLHLTGLGQELRLLNQPHLRFDPGRRVSLSSTRLAILDGNLTVKGDLRLDGPARLNAHAVADALSLSTLQKLPFELPEVTGQVSFDAELSGPLTNPRVLLRLGAEGVQYEDLSEMGLAAELVIRDGRSQVGIVIEQASRAIFKAKASAELTLKPFLGGRPFPGDKLLKTPFTASIDLLPSELNSLPLLAQKYPLLDARLELRIDVEGSALEPRAKIRAQVHEASLDKRRIGDIICDLYLATEKDRTRLEGHIRHDGSALLDVQGFVGIKPLNLVRGQSLDFPLEIDLRIPEQPVAKLVESAPQLADIAGRLSGFARVRGTTFAPSGEFRLLLDEGRMGEELIGSIRAEGHAELGMTQGELQFKQAGGGALRGEFKIEQSNLSSRFEGKDLSIGFVAALVPSIKELAGSLSIDAQAEGKLDDPRIQATVNIDDGLIRFLGTSRLEDIRLQATLQPGLARLDHLEAKSKGGRLALKGSVELDGYAPESFQATLETDDFVFDAGAIKNAEVSTQLTIEGKLQQGLWDGRLKVAKASVKMPKFETGPDLHPTAGPEDIVFVDRAALRARAREEQLAREATSPEALKYKIHATADPVFVRGEDVDVEAAADVTVSSGAEGEMKARGKLFIRRGRVQILGSGYDVQRANILLSGGKEMDPAIDILLSRQVSEATILIGLQGTVSQPDLQLSSDPAIYDRSQILSLIITGQPSVRPGDGGTKGGTNEAMVAASAMSQLLIGPFAEKLTGRLGIDVTRLSIGESAAESGEEAGFRARAELGKYITKRIYVSYRRIFGATQDENSNEAIFEYRISAHWLLSLMFGDAAVGELNVVWSYSY